MKSKVTHLNPDGLHKNPAYSQGVSVQGPGTTLFIGGQNAVNAAGEVVGKGDIAAQAEQVFKNLEIVLQAAGANIHHIIKWNIYIVSGQDIQPAFAVFQRVWGRKPNPPVITGIFVSSLARPEYLMELEATAFLPAE